MKVLWSTLAADDLEHICEWIGSGNAEAARRAAQTVYSQCARLGDFPYIGRPSQRLDGRRELTFVNLPYIVVYKVKPHAIEISRIFHGSQDWP